MNCNQYCNLPKWQAVKTPIKSPSKCIEMHLIYYDIFEGYYFT